MEKIARIKAENISKKFRIGSRNNPALAKIVRLMSKGGEREIQVLKDISLSVNAGEVLGIIGRNGSGKSTLLRIIAGIYTPDEGKVENNGKVFYLSGFDSGLMPRLTMRENIFLVCSILGLSQKDIEKRFNEIVEFAGLKEFVDTEVDKFSSGMTSRLNFSITIHCIQHHSPDILLLDEVIGAGGDIDFNEKAGKKMEELIKSGAAVILVSHNLGAIEKYCNRVLLLEKGKIKREGAPIEIIKEYAKNSVLKSKK